MAAAKSGRDAFHSVPIFSFSKIRDAAESVPTLFGCAFASLR